MDCASKGGLHSKDPSAGKKSKKLPCEPNAASVSANAEQKDPSYWLSGDAKHSCAHLSSWRRSSITECGSAA